MLPRREPPVLAPLDSRGFAIKAGRGCPAPGPTRPYRRDAGHLAPASGGRARCQMTEESRFVVTATIRQAVHGREADVLDNLGVNWRDGRPHIPCPYPDHSDENASWRWDAKHAKARCTCTTSDSIFDVV